MATTKRNTLQAPHLPKTKTKTAQASLSGDTVLLSVPINSDSEKLLQPLSEM